MFDSVDWPVVINMTLFASVLIGAAVYIRSGVQKQAHNEVENLAETRGEIITDLRTEVQQLKEQLSRMEGRIDALENMNTEAIIEGVVVGLSPFLRDGIPGH